MERQRGGVADVLGKINKKPQSHKRIRKKRTAIPVAAPKVPSLASMGSGDGIGGLNYNAKEDKNWRINLTERGMHLLYFHYIFSRDCHMIIFL